jgi:hypothetical protein
MTKTLNSEHEAARKLLERHGIKSGAALVEDEPPADTAEDIVNQVADGSQAPEAPEVAPPEQEGYLLPEEDQAPEATPTQQKPGNGSNPETRWANREEAAKEEQRKLSKLQLSLKETEARLLEREKRLEALEANLSPKVKAQAIDQDPELQAFVEQNPALSDVIKKLAASSTVDPSALSAIQARLDQQDQQRAYAERMQGVISEVTKEIPDAIQIAENDPAFVAYVQGLPKEIADMAERAIWIDTGNANPEFLKWIYRGFKTQTNQSSSAAPATPAAPRAPRAPSIVPANAGPTRGVNLAPLSPEERKRFSSLVNAAGSDREARALLFKRLALSV